MKLLVLIVTLLSLISCHASENKTIEGSNKDLLSKKYFVKGMTCGGCIIGVKMALNKANALNILDKNIEVGQVILRFDKKKYKDSLTDCEVTKSIEKVTEFKVFLDEAYTIRACGS